MLIQPQSVFKILSGVPLSYGNDYSIRFASASAQETYFNSKVEYAYTDFSYVRENRTVRVPVVADSIYKCNYCMFKNLGFGNKWFYGFITDIEYVNNSVTALTIEIDHYQTWLFNFTLGECFVEREHVIDDEIGKHTLPESIPYGDNVVMKTDNHYIDSSDWRVIVKTVPNSFAEVIGTNAGDVIRNQYTGGTLMELPLDASAINSYINNALVTGQEVVNIYMCPHSYIGIQTITVQPTTERPTIFSMPALTEDTYTPYNNKVYTFPYTFLKVSNNQGGEMDLPYELFVGSRPTFELKRGYVNSVTADLRPWMENGATRLQSLSITNFPQCAWHENAFASYLGSGFISDSINSLMSTLNSLGSTSNFAQTTVKDTLGNQYSAQGNLKGITMGSQRTETTSQRDGGGALGTGLASNIASNMFKPSRAKGNSSNVYCDIESNTFGYSFYTMGLKPEFARLVDNYFFRYGYEVDTYKVPTVHSRSAWNYVKTRGCIVKGEIPVEAQRYICSLFNNGFTMWHTTDIGNPDIANLRL